MIRPNIIRALKTCLFLTFIFTYYTTLTEFTLAPIQRIIRRQHDHTLFAQEIRGFLRGKERELILVQIGGTIAAAATIGIFSWDTIQGTTYLAHACWYIALEMALFCNIAANHIAVHSHHVYNSAPQGDKPKPDDYRRMLIVLGIKQTADQDAPDLEKGQCAKVLRFSRCMAYVWQIPIMLMGWSWNFLLMGIIFHITAPLREDHHVGNTRASAIIVLVFHVMLCVQFFASMTILKAVRLQGAKEAEELENDTKSEGRGDKDSESRSAARSEDTLGACTKGGIPIHETHRCTCEWSMGSNAIRQEELPFSSPLRTEVLWS